MIMDKYYIRKKLQEVKKQANKMRKAIRDAPLKLIEGLKCCGNCANKECPQAKVNTNKYFCGYCAEWEWDMLIREQREQFLK